MVLVNHFGKKSGECLRLRAMVLKCISTVDLLADVRESNYFYIDYFFAHFSSRFTDSKRYEAYFEECFSLEELRSGEICNACVLLVKRFIKLPAGSTRHWNHVVDARSGPGIKSMVKSKKAKTDTSNTKDENDTPDKINKKHIYRSKVNRKPVIVRKRNPSIQPSGFLDMNRWTK